MEDKKISPYIKFVSFISVVIYTAVYVYTLQYQNQPFPDRKFPLYDPNPVVQNNTVNVTSNATETNQNSTGNGKDL